MQGLRTQEGKKFNEFFSLVQEEAKKRKAVFFCDCGQGDVFENDSIECEDLCGWLIPNSKVDEFEPHFLNNSEKQKDFDDFYCFVDFEVDGDSVKIKIE